MAKLTIIVGFRSLVSCKFLHFSGVFYTTLLTTARSWVIFVSSLRFAYRRQRASSGHDDGSARQRIPCGDTFPTDVGRSPSENRFFPIPFSRSGLSGRAPHLPKFSPLQGCFRIHGSQVLNFASFEVGREASVLHARIPIAAPVAFSEVSRNSPAGFRGTFRVHVPA